MFSLTLSSNVADLFKTPGKLRGKTPRTARKRNAVEARVVSPGVCPYIQRPLTSEKPLSDVFSSKPQLSPSRQTPRSRNDRHFIVATDVVQQPTAFKGEQKPRSQADSGYHGSSQDEMDSDPVSYPSPKQLRVVDEHIESEVSLVSKQMEPLASEEVRTTEGSFHSAKEEQTTKMALPQLPATDKANDVGEVDSNKQQSTTTVDTAQDNSENPERDFYDIGSPSDESTPDRPLIRKSSLNFASLPAREPLKSNAETRLSKISVEGHRAQTGRPSVLTAKPARPSQGQGTTASEDRNFEILSHENSDPDPKPIRHFRSTQRLQEKIDMLGKALPPRPSKSIPSAAALATSHIAQSSATLKAEKIGPLTAQPPDDDDDWIKPLMTSEANAQPKHSTHSAPEEGDLIMSEAESEEFDMRAPELIAHEERMQTPPTVSPSPRKGYCGHGKSYSTITLVSPGKAEMPPPSPTKTISVSNPALPSTTPQGSPRRIFDSTLSASKSKLHSIMKTAKGLFTSSAGVSAAAKMETLSPTALRLATEKIPGMYPNLNTMIEYEPPPPADPPGEIRKTRSSTEKEKEEKRQEKQSRAMQRMEEQLEKAREKEKQKAAQFKEARTNSASPRKVGHAGGGSTKATEEAKLPEGTETQLHTSKIMRPARPIQSNFTKPKPVPVAIRVGTLSQRMPVSTQSLASTAQETLPAEPRRPGLAKKASNASMHSTVSIAAPKPSAAPQTQKPKALIVAERKREQEEREAQRKLEHKKELERRRAAQQEEVRRQEQQQRAEAERKERERVAAEQAKRQAQQQAIERKRMENAKKVEQQRSDRVTNDVAGNAPNRPPSRLGAAQPLGRSILGHALPTNPAKPAKRPHEEEADSSHPKSGKAGVQQGDSKRRKTEDENEPPRPTMSGAPMRQSNPSKKASIFNHSLYAPAQHQPHLGLFPHPPSQNPRMAHPANMAQYGNGARIPFAEAPNPPPQTNKTPVSNFPKNTLQLVKSSPQYPHGECISLPEIPTDSEDEDSECEGNGFQIPDWATPGHLTEQLLRQESMDGDAIFGPIAPLKMEEIFAKGNKERLKRMRERTSSANWAMSGDGLTLEEIRADREQRQRMRLQGGWRYGN